MPDKETDSNSTSKLKTVIIITIITVIGGFVGGLLTSSLHDKVSKREISLKMVNFIAKDFLKEKPIILEKNPDKKEIDKLIQHKETAFLARELTQHLMENHEYIDFRTLQAALSSIERRYSYAQIYQAANQCSIVCENLILEKNKALQITSQLSKCGSSELEGIILKLLEIDMNNCRFKIQVYNDQDHLICERKTDCFFWIDLGDRLESTSYKYLFLAEYIGYEDVYDQKKPIVACSVLKRTNEVICYPEPLYRRPDNSYWDYKLKSTSVDLNGRRQLNVDEENVDKCMQFFDSDPSTHAQPEAPSLERFGKSILRACGPIRGCVSEREFEALICDHLDELDKFLPKKWKNFSRPEIVAKLKQIWFKHNGFNHVFCGEWEDRTINGLHYRGRYLQLQTENTACYTKSSDEEILDDHIYTIGVTSADGANTHSKKGYALQQSATELFILGISAFEKCIQDEGDWKPYKTTFDKSFYIKSLSAEAEIHYRVICKATTPNDATTYGILTIYPDVTPIEENHNRKTGCRILNAE